MDDSQMRWVMRNHRDYDASDDHSPSDRQLPRKRGNRGWTRISAVGPIAAGLLARQSRATGAQQRVLDVLESRFGQPLTDQLVGLRVSVGTLTLEVQEAAMAYSMRMRWQKDILLALHEQLPDLGISNVRFVTVYQR
jgi:hypothetical protein